MNRKEHLISSLVILAIFQSLFLTFLLMEYGGFKIFLTCLLSILVFIIGCLIPDLDHPGVQKILKLSFLGKITSHRGHFHSIIGDLVYCSIIFAFTYFFVDYWYFVVVAGGLGYFTHLLEDQAHKWYKKTNSRNTIKFI